MNDRDNDKSPARGTRTVLVADDEKDIRDYLELLLENNGFRAITADTAEAAIAAALLEKPDLISLDIQMPGGSGLACYKKIRRNQELAGIPVIIASAFGHPNDFKGARFRVIMPEEDIPEPDAFIEKPVPRDEYIKIVKKLID